ncbi:CHAD domain-containing protein [Candidatus Thiothrix sp. Deng01]|uniref:CHAD domain-containing protein n=1 Tax=Candidatus Thiothrix phosphatis TaxID=3112415 RepID=A0ABU6CZY7_9GAMM|nr:CHAD domain-containing protein [Candidatus Thiothrix sp. Deng01]MEB4591622.1 CHAD domain-containing protein [Candidatus Thiothrix sp. Deng01]
MNTFNINALQERIEHYLATAEQVGHDGSADTIHAFRIASRTVLALEPLLRATSKTRQWRKPMKRWLKGLNHLRDLQVMQERLELHPELSMELEAGVQAELAAWAAIRPHIADKAFRKRLQRSARKFCQHCAAHPGYFPASALLLWWNTQEAVQARFNAITADDPASLHRLRVAFKSLRYLVNTLRNIGAIPADASTGLKHWHDLLGDIQDRQVAQHWLQGKGADATLPARQTAESAQLQGQFMQERAQFQALLTQLDTVVSTSLSAMLTPPSAA